MELNGKYLNGRKLESNYTKEQAEALGIDNSHFGFVCWRPTDEELRNGRLTDYPY